MKKVKPLCPVFGSCGGCSYQNISYRSELSIKKALLRKLLEEQSLLKGALFEDVVASPSPYHYRSRLDLTLRRNRTNGFEMGFQAGKRLIPVEACAIARKEISDFLPELKKQAVAKFPQDYRLANLVVKSGSGKKVYWGGIGRRSLVQPEEDYLWVKIGGKKIFYALDTFSQANLSILPLVAQYLKEVIRPDKKTVFFDLYSGVGLFGILLADSVKKVIMIEESESSVRLAHYNVRYHRLNNVEICQGKVETELWDRPVGAGLKPAPTKERGTRKIGFFDPPRKGLSPAALETLAAAKNFESLVYLSCSPESLVRDLVFFRKKGWKIKRIIPFDFFPKTSHLETMVWMARR